MKKGQIIVMLAAFDIGNTNIVAGCIDNGKILFTERISTDRSATELEYAVIFKAALDMYGIDSAKIDGAVISSVVPPVTVRVQQAVQKITHIEPLIVGPGIKTGLSIQIDNPAQLGSDLVVAAVAGINEYPAPMIIFDLGTATTVSVIDKDKNYVGGMILPGIAVSLESLSGKASQLPYISLDKPKKVVGTNTVDCMKSGMIYGTAAAMDGIIQRICDEYGEKHTVIATGGFAKSVVPMCREKIIPDDDLLMKGLDILYRKNCSR